MVDGHGRQAEQAARRSARWTGKEPETDAIYGTLRGEHARLVTAD